MGTAEVTAILTSYSAVTGLRLESRQGPGLSFLQNVRTVSRTTQWVPRSCRTVGQLGSKISHLSVLRLRTRGAVLPTLVLAWLLYEQICLLYVERKDQYEGLGFGGVMLLKWILKD